MKQDKAKRLIREHIKNSHASTWGEVREVAKPPEMDWMVNWFVDQCVKAGIVKENKVEPVVRNQFYYDPVPLGIKTRSVIPPIATPAQLVYTDVAGAIRVRDATTGDWGEYLYNEETGSYILQGKPNEPT